MSCPDLRDQAAYDGQPASIGAARSFLDAFLTHVSLCQVVPQRQWEAARLVVSELVTNAVRHTPGPCVVTLTVSGTELMIEVADLSTSPPLPEAHGPSRIGRHGLEIVVALCQSLTTHPAPSGKTVAARLSIG